MQIEYFIKATDKMDLFFFICPLRCHWFYQAAARHTSFPLTCSACLVL